MRRTVFYCDRCGGKIEDAGTKIVPHYFDFETEDLISPLNASIEDKHFCIDCTMVIMEAMEPPKEEEKTKKKAKKEKTLDAGKVMALYDAGWDMEKIADEMGIDVTARQVYQCIYYQKNKKSLDKIQEKEATA